MGGQKLSTCVLSVVIESDGTCLVENETVSRRPGILVICEQSETNNLEFRDHYLWPHKSVEQQMTLDSRVICCSSKQTALLVCAFVERSHIFAPFLVQKWASWGSKYL
jgi:hypothetical protein